MNIKHYLSAAAAITLFAACSDYDPGMSGNAVDLTDAEIKTIKEYTENFVDRYGEMDPNHTWGFGDLAGTEEMGTRSVNTNRNQWLSSEEKVIGYDGNNQEIRGLEWSVNTNILPEGAIIPGMPSSVDKKYHTEEGDFDALPTSVSYKDKLHPYGDVTYEEIIYVSNYFRSHTFTDSHVPPFTEFFIQEISHDEDRKEYPNGMWIDEELPVYDSQGNKVDGEDPITFGMDELVVYTNGGPQAGEHINNFNEGGYSPGSSEMSEGGSNPIDENDPDHTPYTNVNTRNIKYWKTNDGYTSGFGYHNSDDSQDYDHYVLRHLSFDIPQSDGTNHHYEGYYLAFDYEFHDNSADGKTSNLERDGHYSNWILKLSPADPNWTEEEYETITVTEPEEQERTISHRIMCEDLGNTYDYDFNDLVFNVTYVGKEVRTKTTTKKMKKDTKEVISETVTYTGWTVDGNGWAGTITLEASGGTLPIYIENFNGQKVECHEYMLGANHANLKIGDNYNPINVGVNLDGVAPKALPTVTGLQTANPDDINIYVYSNDGARAEKQLLLPRSRDAQSDGSSKAPQKLCVPKDMRWLKENQQIEWVYDYFRNWVNNESSEYNFGGTKDWTTTNLKQTEKLY